MCKIEDIKNRLKATFFHLCFSFLLLAIALYFIFLVWYPDDFRVAAGVDHVLWLLLGVDLILGPLLTFVIFDTRKTELKRDLLFIVLIQISAYVYGLHTIAAGRPVSVVFVIDDFEIVQANDLIFSEKSIFKPSLTMSPYWTAASYSQDPILQQKQKEDEIFNGISLARKTEAYQPLSHRSSDILVHAKPINELYRFNERFKVDQMYKSYPDAYGFLPVKGLSVDMTALLNKRGKLIKMVDLRPWD